MGNDKYSRKDFLKKISIGTAGISLGLNSKALGFLGNDGGKLLKKVSFESDWEDQDDRIWVGPNYWANPLEDWRVANGRLENLSFSRGRNVNLLDYQLTPSSHLDMSVTVGKISNNLSRGWAGFSIARHSRKMDYRHNVIYGNGIHAGIKTDGTLFIEDIKTKSSFNSEVVLNLKLIPKDNNHQVVLSLINKSGEKIGEITKDFPAKRMEGNIALYAHGPNGNFKRHPSFYFKKWKLKGSNLLGGENKTWGPILWTQYTLSKNTMKLSAQFPPMGKNDSHKASLEILRNNHWVKIQETAIDSKARTAIFKVRNWDSTNKMKYRVVYHWNNRNHYYEGGIRKDPEDKTTVKLGVFSCDNGYAFPVSGIVENVKSQNPDIVFFAGDQIYESFGRFGVLRLYEDDPSPERVDMAILDYMRKFFQFGWTWKDVLRNTPSVIIPDDHDMFQGNLWGDDGRPLPDKKGRKWSGGGYLMPPEWVNAVQKTQTGHLPDPYSSEPIKQGIETYYTDLVYGRISFAILEDRKFKSGPDHVLTKQEKKSNSPKQLDAKNATLLGKQQDQFLREWTADWRGADMKAVLSQTIFCKSASHTGRQLTPNTMDLDNDGWPQSGRDKALDIIRRGYAYMIHGDQHFSIQVHHGIDNWEDAGISFMITGTAVGYPRAWWPEKPGENHNKTKSQWTGRYLDSLNNRMTVLGVGNPDKRTVNEKDLPKDPDKKAHIKGSGYGMVTFDKNNGTITSEVFRYNEDIHSNTDQAHYQDWPLTTSILDNYGRKGMGYLSPIKWEGSISPVVQIIDESTGDIVYTLRVPKQNFKPKVFDKGPFTLKVGYPESDEWEIQKNIHPDLVENTQ